MSFQRRELTKEQKFALKARLAKARKEAGTFVPRGSDQSVEGDARGERSERSVERDFFAKDTSKNASKDASKNIPKYPQQSNYKRPEKISGSQAAYQQRQQLEEAKRQERERKEAEIQERIEARKASHLKRKEQYKKLKMKTHRGQLNLNNQIEHLLSKISK